MRDLQIRKQVGARFWGIHDRYYVPLGRDPGRRRLCRRVRRTAHLHARGQPGAAARHLHHRAPRVRSRLGGRADTFVAATSLLTFVQARLLGGEAFLGGLVVDISAPLRLGLGSCRQGAF